MARGINRLSARAVESTKKVGLIADGGGLYLQVSKSGAKSWIFKFMLNGRAREMGLGSSKAVSLAGAREKATFSHPTRRSPPPKGIWTPNTAAHSDRHEPF
ncbi:MAG: Arm DNA-binding domain-containing protein [Alphaproteobacteria bacterium]|nr:Arm DNA-binding domain-containing protein [Alphaproteobacteria bacterium]